MTIFDVLALIGGLCLFLFGNIVLGEEVIQITPAVEEVLLWIKRFD